MPKYAVLGGTGQIGGALLERFRDQPDTTLHVYARSASKLLVAHPFLAKGPHRVFEGALTDVQVFADALEGTTAVFGVVGTNNNTQGLRVAQDLANSIIGAVKHLRDSAAKLRVPYTPPRISFITSAGMSRDARLRAQFSKPLHWMLIRVAKYIYIDFEKAMTIFERPENAWIPVIYIAAPGITPGKSVGPVMIGQEIFRGAPLYVTYTDLAEGMVQSIETDQWVGKEIGVRGAKMPSVDYKSMGWIFVTGSLCSWFPSLWRFGYKRGWWGHM